MILAILDTLHSQHSHTGLRSAGSWDFYRDCVILQVKSGYISMFTTLHLPIHEHRISFHLFEFQIISFNNVLQFSVYKSWTIVKFYFTVFKTFLCYLNGILNFLLSDCSLLVQRSTVDFFFYVKHVSFNIAEYIYYFYQVFSCFLRIFYVQGHVISEWDSFSSSFLICMFFISFSCQMLQLEPVVQCWVEVARGDIIILLLIFSGEAFSLSPLHMMLIVRFSF